MRRPRRRYGAWRRISPTRGGGAQASTGRVVADIGCGTGRSFPLLEQNIGPDGELVGVDVCPQMLARAEALVRRRDWRNVTLLTSLAEAAFPRPADAALFWRSARHHALAACALENVIRQLRPGARVVAGGPKWAPPWTPWALMVNLWTWQLNRRRHDMGGLRQAVDPSRPLSP